MSRRLMILAVLMGVGFGYAFAQPKSDCPVINVLGPKGAVNAGETARYSAQVEPNNASWVLEYRWTVSDGIVKSGQGTSEIEVSRTTDRLTVTVEVRGLPSNCPATASEIAFYDPPPMAEALGTISGPLTRRNLASLRNLLARYNDDQYVQFWFIIAGKDEYTQGKKLEALKRLFRDAPDRVRYVLASKTDDKIILWAVPPGAKPPKQ